MSWDINHVVVVGRLTRDPELKYTQSGAAVARFSIAVNRSSGSRKEDSEETTSFFNVVAWNKTAEICNEYLTKGKQVGIDGRLQQRSWSGNDGVRRSSVEIVANNIQFFGPARPQQQRYEGEPTEAEGSSPAYLEPGRSTDEASEQEGKSDPFLSELDDDEIPF
jgi:single-strand DNA-binding protein